ncbi:RNA polymerase sigma-70 factor, ECF subfamily [Luteibacter sp. UNC138MFCol5.1]|uniref:RNA polymerase sigma factor n=1 Tax=Luteibacter sp. UNC138MFCol5.1 TaxID=1502774 RepID=UPI0008BEE994|nr:sigma-70 family RNA polymerase sigma factor [Luteibacter sp. UNC138MFCol5.1]SEO73730.1 RNA polymerase sigma-70 factor, ECF subfamily [Luteibacter sp. UNC138MFCol5.1]
MSDPRIDEALRTMLPRLRRFALWLARDVHAADDLVQSTVERALSRWHTRRDEESLRGWLFSILYRLFLDGKRRSARQALLLGSLPSEEPTWPSAERVALAHSTLAAFAALPVEQRSLLLWITVEGMSYREVADILKVPVGTVMSRLSRARRALRQLGEGDSESPSLRLLK